MEGLYDLENLVQEKQVKASTEIGITLPDR